MSIAESILNLLKDEQTVFDKERKALEVRLQCIRDDFGIASKDFQEKEQAITDELRAIDYEMSILREIRAGAEAFIKGAQKEKK